MFQWFSLTTSLVGIVSQPFLYQQLSALQNLPMLVVGCSFVGVYTFVTPFLLHYVTKKYVTKVDYNSEKDTYIASTTNFFGLQREVLSINSYFFIKFTQLFNFSWNLNLKM